jgi:hypothetical protein
MATNVEKIDLTMNEGMNGGMAIRLRPRALPKCGYCGVYGHQVRKCNNEYIINEANKIYLLISRMDVDTNTIINMFMEHNSRNLKFLSMDLLNIPYHKQVTREEIVTKLSNFIKEKRDMQLSNMLVIFTRWLAKYDEVTDGLVRYICGEDYAYHCPSDINERDMELVQIEDLLKLVRTNPYNRFRFPALWQSYIYDNFDVSTLVNGRETMNRYILFIKSLILDNSITDKIDWVVNTSSVIMEDMDCPICMETTKNDDIVVTQCGHSFCCNCINSTIKTAKAKDPTKRCNCPMCREPLTKITYNFITKN